MDVGCFQIALRHGSWISRGEVDLERAFPPDERALRPSKRRRSAKNNRRSTTRTGGVSRTGGLHNAPFSGSLKLCKSKKTKKGRERQTGTMDGAREDAEKKRREVEAAGAERRAVV